MENLISWYTQYSAHKAPLVIIFGKNDNGFIKMIDAW